MRAAKEGKRTWGRRWPALCLFLLAPSGLSGQTAPPVAADPQLRTLPMSADQAARAVRALAPPADFTSAEPFEGLPGGAATLTAPTPPRDLFSAPSANMVAPRTLDFELGKALFDKLWVAAPASTRASDGLGPLYNARACQACHLRDGRGRLPEGEKPVPGLVLRFALPDPAYGTQLQDQAAPGQTPEGQVVMRYGETPVTLGDGTALVLRRPVFSVGDPAYGTAPAHGLSPRLAPAMIGLGLLEAISAADILAGADAEDRDGDGISGRAALVWSDAFGRLMLGRFGLKASVASVQEQVARALSADMGLSSPLEPAASGDCTPAQTACRSAPDGEEPDLRDGREVDGASLDLLTFYARNLAVPARRTPDDPAVLRGKALFYGAGCADCHRPKFVTSPLEGQPEQSFQLIWPYTDLLLHDMGEGLADGGGEAGREWRTPPLWGIGLAGAVNGQGVFLHDGRARTILEAVLWHGGEAAASRDQAAALSTDDRNALISFLESL